MCADDHEPSRPEINAALEQLPERDPSLLGVHASLGLNQQKLGRHAEAAEDFKAVLSRTRSACAFRMAKKPAIGRYPKALRKTAVERLKG